MRDPTRPRRAGKLTLPVTVYRESLTDKRVVVTTDGFALLARDQYLAVPDMLLLQVDLRNPDVPKLSEQPIPERSRHGLPGFTPETRR